MPGPGRRWKKGQSGNLKGRPPVAEAFRSLVDRELDELQTAMERYIGKSGEVSQRQIRIAKKQLLVKRMIEHALAGNGPVLKELLNRYLGRVPMQLGVDGNLTLGGQVKVHEEVTLDRVHAILEEEREKRAHRIEGPNKKEEQPPIKQRRKRRTRKAPIKQRRKRTKP